MVVGVLCFVVSIIVETAAVVDSCVGFKALESNVLKLQVKEWKRCTVESAYIMVPDFHGAMVVYSILTVVSRQQISGLSRHMYLMH